MKIDDSSLFFTCSLLELIGRTTRQKRNAVVNTLGKKVIGHIYASAGVLHCEPIAKTADYYIDFCHISAGDFDNVASCKYTVPTYWDIGKVYARLIEDVAGGDVIDTLFQVYNSVVCDMISNFNSDFFYQSRDYIKEYFIANGDSIEENCKKPAIRFSGFTDAWEQRELGTFITEVTRRDAESRAPVMMIAAASGFIEQSEKYSSDNAGQSLAKYTVLHRGELAYNHGASKFRKYGSCFALNIEAARVPFVYHCFDVGQYNPSFVALVLNVPQIDTQLRKLVSSGARMDGLLNISFEAYKTVEIMLPKRAEQDKIATFLSALDDLITLHQRKYDKLSKIKKSMLEKLFPKNGSNVPEIRFAGFTDAWEQRRLGDAVDRVVRKNTNHESSLPLTISAQYGLVDQITYFNNRVASRDISNYYLIMNGEFAYNKSTSDGFPFGAVKRLDLYDKGVLSTLYIVFSIKDKGKTNSDFLAVFFDTDRWHRGVAERAAEGARNHGLLNITADDFFDIGIFFPKKETEQAKIGIFFRSLDRLITLHQRELEKLKKIKQSCLEKMFV